MVLLGDAAAAAPKPAAAGLAAVALAPASHDARYNRGSLLYTLALAPPPQPAAAGPA